MMGTGRFLAAVAASALLCCAATPAQAQDATDALLLKLKEKGILTEDEYQSLLQRKAQTPAVVATAPASTADAPQQAAAQALDDKKLIRMMDSGVGFQLGEVGLKFSGSINGFYVHDNGDRDIPSNTVVGGLATVGDSSSSIRNGLLPGFLRIDVTTRQMGLDVGAHFGLYPGINSVSNIGGANSGGTPTALATSGIDARQTYLTFGDKSWGEVKIGRDIGMFGSDAILNDITLLSVGTAAGNSAPSNTSLGRIGLGYIYTDFQPQISYSSPKFGGLQFAVGVFQPLVTAGDTEINGTPGFQGKVTYDMVASEPGGLGAHAWLGGIVQRHDSVLGLPEYTGRGIDGGAKLSFGPASLTGYYYTGRGLGTTGLFILATDARGNKRDSDGFYVQGTVGIDKFTLGGSYGQSNLDLADGEINPTLLKANTSYVGQVRYGLTGWVTLVGEYTHTRSVAHNGNDAKSDALAAGAILFF